MEKKLFEEMFPSLKGKTTWIECDCEEELCTQNHGAREQIDCAFIEEYCLDKQKVKESFKIAIDGCETYAIKYMANKTTSAFWIAIKEFLVEFEKELEL